MDLKLIISYFVSAIKKHQLKANTSLSCHCLHDKRFEHQTSRTGLFHCQHVSELKVKTWMAPSALLDMSNDPDQVLEASSGY